MILGQTTGLDKQRGTLPEAVQRALNALGTMAVASMAPGRYDVEGDDIFCLVQDATPRQLDESRAEAHRDYADVQLPIGAVECFGFSLPQPGLTPVEEDFDTRDIAFYPTPDNECFVDVAPGEFIVFWPGELHRPCIVIDSTAPFRKVVVKIHRRLLGL